MEISAAIELYILVTSMLLHRQTFIETNQRQRTKTSFLDMLKHFSHRTNKQ